MKIIVCSDSFKETLSSIKVNNIIKKACLEVFPESDIITIPIADGGEGTLDTFPKNTKILTCKVMGALPDHTVEARWGILDDTAIIESAEVIGLNLLPKEKRDPNNTTSYGIGELLSEARINNVKNIIIGLGGSSTNDAGAGILQALGIKLLDQNNQSLGFGGLSLRNLSHIDFSHFQFFENINIICLSDVKNKLCGPNGATHIFAKQKGAKEGDLQILDNALLNFAKITQKDIGIDMLEMEGGGAAGGIAAGMVAFLNAKIQSGIETILQMIGFEYLIEDADLIITGEGKIDYQSTKGKAISGITKYSKGKPTIAFVGILEGNKEKLKSELDLVEIYPIVNENITAQMSLGDSEKYLFETAIKGLEDFKKSFLHLS